MVISGAREQPDANMFGVRDTPAAMPGSEAVPLPRLLRERANKKLFHFAKGSHAVMFKRTPDHRQARSEPLIDAAMPLKMHAKDSAIITIGRKSERLQ
jgi:hypothetical protein